MGKYIIKIHLYALCMVCLPVPAQNMASIEAPSGISFVYGLDYHPVWYTQLKPAVGFAWSNNSLTGIRSEMQYGFTVEQRYYYNIIKRQSKGKNTRHKSADYFSVKPTYAFSRVKHANDNVLTSISGKNKYDCNYFWCSFNWGMRRAMGQRFYFDGSIGLGPSYSTDTHRWESMVDLNLCIGFKLF